MKECPTCCRCFPDNVNHCPADGEALRFTITGDTVLDSRYQLERRLGQGGMGVVYKGRHVFLKTQHAIKIILPDLVGNDPSLTTRFRQEAMAAAAIRHQNIVSVTDFGVVNNTTPFLVMEFLEGRSLHELLTAEGRLPPRRAIEIMLAVASGVAAAHRQGIVHRDLKPLNIMLLNGETASEGLKILDFGLAKIKSGDLLGSFVAAKTQGLMGSPFYMAPEQWGDDEPDARSDIYSLGIILYQMLAGEVPFKGNSIPSIMNKHLTAPPSPLAEKGIETPPEVERVVLRALEKEPDKRPQTVEEFAAELHTALAALAPPAPAFGADTSPDIGLRTVAIKEPDTVPPEAPKTSETQAGDFALGGKTIAEAAPPSDAPRGFETVASSEAFRGETSPGTEVPQARQTVHDFADAPATAAPPLEAEKPSVAEEKQLTPSLPTLDAPVRDKAPDVQKTHAGAPTKTTQPLSQQPHTVHQIVTPKPSEAPKTSEAPQIVAPTARIDVAPPIPPTDDIKRPLWSRLPIAVWAAAGILALLCVVAGLYIVLKDTPSSDATNAGTSADASASTNTSTTTNAGTTPSPQPDATPFKPDLVQLPGGTFMMGRSDVPSPPTEGMVESKDAWIFFQWPAHSVTIAPFAIDRTEVTNAEYAEFVEQTGYPSPSDWGGKRPPAGQEMWPVRNVSYEDARRFAQWRSRRDGAEYRLPTEAEWEYAARGGDSTRLYPWGNEWAAGRANLESDAVKPVGSHPDGATPQGVQDMIGNVWEWTSTKFDRYEGSVLVIPADIKGKYVLRGGGYENRPGGESPITATARYWASGETKDHRRGFRLVRPGR